MILRKLIALVTIVACTAGCGEPMATVSGVVHFDGKPISLAENVRGTVVFQPGSRQGPTLNGSFEDGGKFQLTAGSNSLVTPGVYLATVSAVEVLPATADDPQPKGKRVTPDRYASSGQSGLRYAIKAGENDLIVELKSEASDEENVAAEENTENLEPATDSEVQSTVD